MGIVIPTAQSSLVKGAGQLKAELETALRSGAPVVIDTTDLADVDLSFLQTVEAARRQASANGGDVALSEPAGDGLRAVLDRAGLSATFTPADRSFWLHEGK